MLGGKGSISHEAAVKKVSDVYAEFRKKQEAEMTIDEAVAAALELVRQGEKPTAAAKQAAKDSGYSRSEIYSRIAIQQENE